MLAPHLRPLAVVVILAAAVWSMRPPVVAAAAEEETGPRATPEGKAGSDAYGAPAATADDTESEAPTLYGVIASPDGGPVPAFFTSRAVLATSADTITDRSIAATPTALPLAGAFFARSHYGGGGGIVRGLGGSRLSVLVDGVPLNNSTTRTGFDEGLARVDAWSIRRLEVLHGPRGVRWGLNAPGGAIHVVTRTASTHRTTGIVRPHATLRYGTADSAGTGRLGVRVENFGVGLVGGLSAKLLGDLRGGAGIGLQTPSRYKEWNTDAKLTVGVLNGHELNLAIYATRAHDVPHTHRCPPASGISVGPPLPPGTCTFAARRTRTLGYLRYRYVIGTGIVENADVTLSLHHQGEIRDAKPFRDAVLSSRATERVLTPGISAHFDTSLGQKSFVLHYGGAAYLDRIRSRSVDFSDVGTTPDPTRGRHPLRALHLGFGIFARGEWTPIPPLLVYGGARFGGVAATSPDDPIIAPRTGFSFFGASTEIGVSLRLADTLHVALTGAQGFRPPSWDDFSGLGAELGSFDVPNPDLRPERFLAAALGPRFRAGPIDLTATASVMRLDRPMVRLPATWIGAGEVAALRVLRLENASHGVVLAGEVAAALRIGLGWSGFAGVTWTWSRVAVEGFANAPLGRVPPLFGRAGLRWQGSRGFVEAALEWASPRRSLAEEERADITICPTYSEACPGTPGFLTFSLHAGWEVGDGVRATLSVNNVGNEAYRLHGSGIYEAGASAVVGVDIRL